jgi:hypothetical protein
MPAPWFELLRKLGESLGPNGLAELFAGDVLAAPEFETLRFLLERFGLMPVGEKHDGRPSATP